MKLIPLTQGQYAKVDDWMYDYLMQWKWYAVRYQKSPKFYACRNASIKNGKKRKCIKMHNEIINPSFGYIVDHISGDTLDNTCRNLRIARHFENIRNRGIQKNNTSGYIGVGWHKLCNKWRAYYRTTKTIEIGYYDTAEEAARARDEKVKEHYGEFAVLNFPDVARDKTA